MRLAVFCLVVAAGYVAAGFVAGENSPTWLAPAITVGLYPVLIITFQLTFGRSVGQGLYLYYNQKYPEAIEALSKGVAFFDRHRLLDRVPFLFVTGDPACYREQALLTMAACYGQMGEGARAKAAYEHVLEQFPQSNRAAAVLNIIQAAKGGTFRPHRTLRPPECCPMAAIALIVLACLWVVLVMVMNRHFPGMVPLSYYAYAYLGLAAYHLAGNRFLIPHLPRAWRHLKKNEYEQAISAYTDAAAFFARHAWMDQFRSVLFLSLLSPGFREVALNNIGYCYSQMGDGAGTKAAYKLMLEAFPESRFATYPLTLFRTAEDGG